MRALPNQTVQRTGASRFAHRQIQRHRRLAPVADFSRWAKMRDVCLIVAVAILSVGARGDTWDFPNVEVVTSPDRSGLVRVVPGGSNATAVVMRFSDSQREYRRIAEVQLSNLLAPVAVLVTNNARYIVTFDDWGYLGSGRNVVVVYDSNGKCLKSWSLSDIFTEDEIRTFTQTASSTWWRGKVAVLEAAGFHPKIEIFPPERGWKFGGSRNPASPIYLELSTLTFRK
jgi:hypothetical protein